MKPLSFLVLVAIILVSITSLKAQPNKGSFAVAGSVSYKVEKNETEYPSSSFYSSTTHSFNLSPKASYFIVKRFAVGLEVPYRWSKFSYNADGSMNSKGNSNSIGVGPFARYYQPFGEKIYGIVHLAYSWNRTKSNNEQAYFDPFTGSVQYGTFKSEYILKSTTLGLGCTYFLQSNIGLELMAELTGDDQENPESSGYTSSRNNIALSLGLQIYFHRGEE